jgi:hypothetical protein
MLFLSDAYCSTAVCVREYLAATRSAKVIIPILLQDKGPIHQGGPASGWSGAGGEDKEWWRHADACSSCLDPDTSKSFTWSALSLFTPIDLRTKSTHDSSTHDASTHDSQSHHSAALLEIVKRLQACFHRGSVMQDTVLALYSSWRKLSILERLPSFRACRSFSSIDWDGARAEALVMFSSLDLDDDGLISQAELAYWCVEGGVPLQDELAAFQKSMLGNVSKDHLHVATHTRHLATRHHPFDAASAAAAAARGSSRSGATVVVALDFAPLDLETTRQVMGECRTCRAGGEGGGGGDGGLVAFDELWSVLTDIDLLSLS